VSVAIRIEVLPFCWFDLDLMTNSGEVKIARDDLHKPAVGVRRLYHEANGGGQAD
jgi:hypothetical protein